MASVFIAVEDLSFKNVTKYFEDFVKENDPETVQPRFKKKATQMAKDMEKRINEIGLWDNQPVPSLLFIFFTLYKYSTLPMKLQKEDFTSLVSKIQRNLYDKYFPNFKPDHFQNRLDQNDKKVLREAAQEWAKRTLHTKDSKSVVRTEMLIRCLSENNLDGLGSFIGNILSVNRNLSLFEEWKNGFSTPEMQDEVLALIALQAKQLAMGTDAVIKFIQQWTGERENTSKDTLAKLAAKTLRSDVDQFAQLLNEPPEEARKILGKVLQVPGQAPKQDDVSITPMSDLIDFGLTTDAQTAQRSVQIVNNTTEPISMELELTNALSKWSFSHVEIVPTVAVSNPGSATFQISNNICTAQVPAKQSIFVHITFKDPFYQDHTVLLTERTELLCKQQNSAWTKTYFLQARVGKTLLEASSTVISFSPKNSNATFKIRNSGCSSVQISLRATLSASIVPSSLTLQSGLEYEISVTSTESKRGYLIVQTPSTKFYLPVQFEQEEAVLNSGVAGAFVPLSDENKLENQISNLFGNWDQQLSALQKQFAEEKQESRQRFNDAIETIKEQEQEAAKNKSFYESEMQMLVEEKQKIKEEQDEVTKLKKTLEVERGQLQAKLNEETGLKDHLQKQFQELEQRKQQLDQREDELKKRSEELERKIEEQQKAQLVMDQRFADLEKQRKELEESRHKYEEQKQKAIDLETDSEQKRLEWEYMRDHVDGAKTAYKTAEKKAQEAKVEEANQKATLENQIQQLNVKFLEAQIGYKDQHRAEAFKKDILIRGIKNTFFDKDKVLHCRVICAWEDTDFLSHFHLLIEYLKLAGFSIPFNRENPAEEEYNGKVDRVILIGTRKLRDIKLSGIAIKKSSVVPVIFQGTAEDTIPATCKQYYQNAVNFVGENYHEQFFYLTEKLLSDWLHFNPTRFAGIQEMWNKKIVAGKQKYLAAMQEVAPSRSIDSKIRFVDVVTREEHWIAFTEYLSGQWRILGNELNCTPPQLDRYKRSKDPVRVMLADWQHKKEATARAFLQALIKIDNETARSYFGKLCGLEPQNENN